MFSAMAVCLAAKALESVDCGAYVCTARGPSSVYILLDVVRCDRVRVTVTASHNHNHI